MLGAFVSIVIILFFSIKNNAVKPLLFLLVLLSGVLAVSYVDIQSLDYANRGNTREETWASMYEEASRSEEHTSEVQSLMRISYAVFCLKKKITKQTKAQIKEK